MVARLRRRSATARPRERNASGEPRVSAPRSHPAPAALPLGVGGPVAHEVPSPGNFEGSLQHLIANFFLLQDQTSENAVLESLQRLFVSLAHELGRVDAAARLHGVPREDTLRMLRTCMAEGKRSTLAQHEKGCACQASKVLEAELESN